MRLGGVPARTKATRPQLAETAGAGLLYGQASSWRRWPTWPASISPVSPLASPPPTWRPGRRAMSVVAGDPAYGWTARFGLLNLARVRALGVTGQVYAGRFRNRARKAAQRRRSAAAAIPTSASTRRRCATWGWWWTPPLRRRPCKSSWPRSPAPPLAPPLPWRPWPSSMSMPAQGLPDGKKSLAYSLVFRAPDRTLTDARGRRRLPSDPGRGGPRWACAIRK